MIKLKSGVKVKSGVSFGAHRKVGEGVELDPATVAYIDRVLSVENAQIKNVECTDSFIRMLRAAGLLDGANKLLGAYSPNFGILPSTYDPGGGEITTIHTAYNVIATAQDTDAKQVAGALQPKLEYDAGNCIWIGKNGELNLDNSASWTANKAHVWMYGFCCITVSNPMKRQILQYSSRGESTLLRNLIEVTATGYLGYKTRRGDETPATPTLLQLIDTTRYVEICGYSDYENNKAYIIVNGANPIEAAIGGTGGTASENVASAVNSVLRSVVQDNTSFALSIWSDKQLLQAHTDAIHAWVNSNLRG
jgi:hypothetical protein